MLRDTTNFSSTNFHAFKLIFCFRRRQRLSTCRCYRHVFLDVLPKQPAGKKTSENKCFSIPHRSTNHLHLITTLKVFLRKKYFVETLDPERNNDLGVESAARCWCHTSSERLEKRNQFLIAFEMRWRDRSWLMEDDNDVEVRVQISISWRLVAICIKSRSS